MKLEIIFKNHLNGLMAFFANLAGRFQILNNAGHLFIVPPGTISQ